MSQLKINDIVLINKKTRMKLDQDKKPEIGKFYLIKSMSSSYTNYGYDMKESFRYYLVGEDSRDYISNSNNTEYYSNLDELEAGSDEKMKWDKILETWMERNYIPVIVSHIYSYSGSPITYISNNSHSHDNLIPTSYLVKPINSDSKFWLDIKNIHSEDIENFRSIDPSFKVVKEKHGNISETKSVRIPLWLAKYRGIIKK